jgi:hypothetical protein
MSAQQRYRTLVHHIGRIYAAPEGTRTELLQTGLDQIVSVVGPMNASTWTTVSADSDRLLKVWVAKEREHNEVASAAVAEQLADMLRELASTPGVCYEPPASVLCDKPCPDAGKPMTLAAVVEPPKLVVEDVAPVKPAPKPVIEPVTPPTSKPVVEVAKQVVKAEIPATIAHVEDEDDVEYEVEEEEDDSSKPSADDEGEVLEPEGEGDADADEEEEEAGMEVEQIMIRGRAWWLEVNTQKIYAVIDGDDVGDEVGEMVGGKPRFYAK